jgi:hypothetical protein
MSDCAQTLSEVKGVALTMSPKIALLCGCVLLVAGCSGNTDDIPKIVDAPQIATTTRTTWRPLPVPPVQRRDPGLNVPWQWVPPKDIERKWTAIVIHHSASDNGNAEIFDEYHRKSKHWQGVGYDFVIGNGTDSGDGQVEVTFRWRQQLTGAHCKTPGNWANEEAVGICLVGNFDNDRPTARQMQSLLKLVRFLQRRYSIPALRIYGHKDTPGAGVTDCPGRYFPMARFKSML